LDKVQLSTDSGGGGAKLEHGCERWRSLPSFMATEVHRTGWEACSARKLVSEQERTIRKPGNQEGKGLTGR
jgi:hypothetical protein